MNGSAHNGAGNGWDHDEPGAIVDAAVEAVGREDPEAGRWAELAAGFLTAGEGPQVLSQERLQEFLWYGLPRKFPLGDWVPIVDGTARFLDQLGLTRYAEVARSTTTREILVAWEADDDALERYRSAMDASGLVPPDTELLDWGAIMSGEEYAAYDAVAQALEAAIVAGELHPGATGWRKTAASVTRRTLEERVRPMAGPDSKPRRRLDLALGGRVEHWILGGYPDLLRDLRRAAAARFLDGHVAIAPEPPSMDAMQTAIAPMAWLLERCRDGVKATAKGYLSPPVVREAAEQFDWWIFRGLPRSEIDVIQLTLLHEIATRNRWVLRRSGQIRTTRPALALLDDPVDLWWAIVKTIGGREPFTAMISELIAYRLLEGPVEHIGLVGEPSELAQVVSPVLLEQGWRQNGAPIRIEHIDEDIHEPLREWRLFGLLGKEWYARGDDRPDRRPTVSLSETGQVAIAAHLYARATEPRNEVFD